MVIVQIVPPAPVDDLGDRLISACTQGLRQGACVLSGEGDASQRSTLAAEVHWDEGFRVATIRVLRQGSTDGAGMSGKIVFDDDDAIEDRWTTAGFTVATLVGDLTEWADAKPVAQPEQPAPKRHSIAPASLPTGAAAPAPSAERWLTLRSAAGLEAGQGMHDHALRAGPWASVSFAHREIPVALLFRGALAWASANGVSVRWSTITLGMEARWPLDPGVAGVVLAAQGGVSHLIAKSQRTASRASATLSLFLGGEVVLGGPFGLVAGARAEAGPTTQLATPAEEIVDRRIKLGGSLGVLVKL